MVEDVAPRKVWAELQDDPAAVLCDVRTDAEWNFVGIPDLAALGKEPVLIPWQLYPSMQVNHAFAEHLRAAGLTAEHRIYFICRSGARSRAAAEAARAAGFAHVFNVATGFEGARDADGHRGTVGGWKADGLPWRQG
jgi:rhodanese-related sulfurtransferase